MADTVNTSQTVTPWDAQQPYLKDIFKQAQKQYKAPGPFPFPDQMTAGYSPQEQLGQQQTEAYAQGGAQDLANQLGQAQSFSLGNVLNPASNPYLQAHAAGAVKPIREELTQQILPQMGSGAVIAGAYGGDRQGIAQGLATDRATENMADMVARIYSDNYQAGLDTFSKGIQQTPTTISAGTLPMQMLSAAGEMDRSLAQNLLNEDIYRWNFAQQQPGASLAQYQNAIQGSYGGNSTGQIPNQFQDPSSFEKGLSTLTTSLGAVNLVNDLSGGALSDWFGGLF